MLNSSAPGIKERAANPQNPGPNAWAEITRSRAARALSAVTARSEGRRQELIVGLGPHVALFVGDGPAGIQLGLCFLKSSDQRKQLVIRGIGSSKSHHGQGHHSRTSDGRRLRGFIADTPLPRAAPAHWDR